MQVKRKLILSILLAIIAGLYSIIYFRNVHTISTTGDIAFHFARIKGLSSVFSGPINFTTFNHYGSGVNYFYPYLTLFPAVIFYWVSHHLIASYILYVWLLNVCTSLLMFHYGLKFLKQMDAAFLFSCLYTFYGYRTIDIYHRSAIAEAIALTVIPIVMYYAYALIYEKKRCAVPLAVSMSFLVYTHVLSTFMCAVAVGLLLLGSLAVSKTRRKESIRLLVEMAKAVGMTILLTVYFWYPMLRQLMVQSINKPDKTTLQNQALNVSDSLLGAINNDLATFTIGIVGVISLILPLFFYKRFHRKEKVIYLSAVALWFLSTKLFPWALLQNTPVQMIQFPWRILGFQILFGSLILALVFMKQASTKQKKIVSLSSIVLLLLLLSAAAKANYGHKVVTQKEHLVMNQENLLQYTTMLPGGLYDYAPMDALKYKEYLQNHEVKIGKQWQKMPYQAMDSKIIYTIHEANGQKITLPVYDYWGTVAKVNGQKSKIENNEGLVTIEGKEPWSLKFLPPILQQ